LVADASGWTLLLERPGKRIWSRYDGDGDKLIIREEWIEDAALESAALQRELSEGARNDMRPVAVIPNSVKSRALNEGWYNDDAAWRRWANDIDNRRLRITGGYL
jgi:hypothetical protein